MAAIETNMLAKFFVWDEASVSILVILVTSVMTSDYPLGAQTNLARGCGFLTVWMPT